MSGKRKPGMWIHFMTVFWVVVVVGVTAGCLGLFVIQKTNSSQEHMDKKTSTTDWAQTGWEKITETEKEEVLIPAEKREDSELSLAFAGDILFDDNYSPMVALKKRENGIFDCISEKLMNEMHSADILMVNNEFPYSNRGTPTEGKTYTFRANPENANYLIDMGVDIVSLANNHAYDYGEDALVDTFDTLNALAMPYVGAGKNLEEAMKPIYFSAGDLTVAYIAATQIERLANPDTKEATENGAGVFRCLYPEKLYELITETKEKADFVIVYVHWGTENTETPDWAQLEQAKGMAEAGADLIVGDHPHCLQGIDVIGETPVIYSLGNFWFNSKEMRTGLITMSIDMEGIKDFRFIPAYQKECRTTFSEGTQKEETLQYLRSLSPNVTIDSEGYITW